MSENEKVLFSFDVLRYYLVRTGIDIVRPGQLREKIKK